MDKEIGLCYPIEMKITYKTNNNISYSCKYHIVFCPKYRKKILIGEVESRLKEIIRSVCLEVKSKVNRSRVRYRPCSYVS